MIDPRLKTMTEQGGFLTGEKDLEICMKQDKYMNLLIRTGTGREVAPAIYLNDRMTKINENGDYVRDVSITVAELEKIRAVA